MCLEHKKAALELVAGFPLSRHFNDVISMNLKEINGFKIWHLIDHATFYSGGTINKKKRLQNLKNESSHGGGSSILKSY